MDLSANNPSVKTCGFATSLYTREALAETPATRDEMHHSERSALLNMTHIAAVCTGDVNFGLSVKRIKNIEKR